MGYTPPDQNLFEESKMSFGAHLDDLRLVLIRSATVLLVGFLIGLFFAKPMITFIQSPLTKALQEFYQTRATNDFKKQLTKLNEENTLTPEQIDAATLKFQESGLIPQPRYIDRRQLKQLFAPFSSEKSTAGAAPATSPDLKDFKPLTREDLLPITFYIYSENDPRVQIIGTGVSDGFMVVLKAAFALGAIISGPIVLYFFWGFVAAGLYPHEKNQVYLFLPISIGLFLSGAALAFFVVFQFVLRFLFDMYQWMNLETIPKIDEWLGFVFILPLGFGISFQLPLVMLFFERIGVIPYKMYLEKWRIAVLVIAFLSMVLTPSDPWSMALMGIPLIFLYYAGILLCKHMPRKKSPFASSDSSEDAVVDSAKPGSDVDTETADSDSVEPSSSDLTPDADLK